MVSNAIKNEELILNVLKLAGPITKTKLVKLLFLIDNEASAKINKKISSFAYVKYFYGPYPPELEDILSYLSAKGIIHYNENISCNGRRYYLISIDSPEYQKRGEMANIFSEKEEQIIRSIVNKYKDKSLEDILESVYALDSVEKATFGADIL
ncbi:hypothetical protein IX53_01625 [Kosmotoga pacifica]|uniref:Antitoxin SocA-like Panacea domain-containing protein n=2 Tax=Kosmotoga pacifica TaxID=1330330 RepID=A0A0G2ZD41_9BACT|nr:hypothetical protein IX53_01625 [Kosmotoga pacifica]